MSRSIYSLDDVRSPATGTASVGDRVEKHQVFSVRHPLYQNFSEQVANELEALRQEAFRARQAAKKILITSTLPTEEIDVLNSWYPEFDVASVPINTPVHSLWSAAREASNELLATSVGTYAESVLHFGGSRLANVFSGRSQHVVQHNLYDAVQAENEYRDAVDMHRIYQDEAAAADVAEVAFDRKEYDKLLSGEAYASVGINDKLSDQFEGFCADLSITDMSPSQFAAQMLQCGAQVGFGFLIYHPLMLVQTTGAFPGMGVSYEFKDHRIQFIYPEGRVGVASYHEENWQAWIASHNFSIGEDSGKEWFALELLDTRGCFLSFRMVKLDECPVDSTFRHAMEILGTEDHVLVESWRLRDGLRGDPNNVDHWEQYRFLVSSRVEKRVREFAMQLKPDAFKRETIKKQIRVVNNRWVLKGSEVVVMPVLDPRDIEALTTAIYSRVFVERYESGTLSRLMMEQLRTLVNFNSMSTKDRFLAVARALTCKLYNSTIGALESVARDAADSLIAYLGEEVQMRVRMMPPPTYRTFESTIRENRGKFSSVVQDVGGGLRHIYSKVNLAAPGGMLLKSLGCTFDQTESNGEGAEKQGLLNVMRVVTDYLDTRVAVDSVEQNAPTLDALAATNELDEPADARFVMEFSLAERRTDDVLQRFKAPSDLDPVATLNAMYVELFPAVAQSTLEFDSYHMSLDPQDRSIEAPYMAMPTYFGLAPPSRSAFRSRLTALNIPKKQNVASELLNAITQRNCAAPVISLPQEDDQIIPEIWENFLSVACVEDARDKLLTYQNDPVSSSAQQYTDWMGQCTRPSTLLAVRKELEDHSRMIGECDVSQYIGMLKADVKPTLSEKPVREITAPQMIVYHEKFLSSFYSSMFRVLTRRLLSLLKPNIHCNLLKDLSDIEAWVSSVHPYGATGLQYLENDFSKFDKSQSRFVFELEEYVFRRLGLNEEMLQRWVGGHIECTIRAVSIGLTLHVMYQRKSGDATTAFGNGLLNMLSVFYAYKDTKIEWGVFMGDDSLVCTRRAVTAEDAVQVLAEVFNLSAKYYITDQPYFASTFFLIDAVNCKVRLMPDPVKRIEKLSMHISADDPQWNERYTSYKVSLAGYRETEMIPLLAKNVAMRYAIPEGLVRGAATALASLVFDFDKFRSLWETQPLLIDG